MRRQSDLNDIYGVKRIRTNPLEKGNDAPESGFRHSDAYHKYFRGYAEIRREKPGGGYCTERYYTQPWIVSTASDTRYWLTRLMYVSLICMSWFLYLWAMNMKLESNRAWFVIIPGFPAVILLVVMSMVTVLYVFMRKRMTLWDYESSSNHLKKVSLLTGGCMAMTAGLKVIYAVIFGEDVAGELLSAGITMLSAVSAAAICMIERGVVYTAIPNDTVLPEGEAHEI